MTSKVVYTGGYANNTPDDIIDLLNASARVAFQQTVFFGTPEEIDKILTGFGTKDRVTFRITVEKLP